MKRSLLLVASLAMIAPACWSHGGVDGDRVRVPPPRPGGTLLLGAEQYPECLNPITQCASAPWQAWSVTQHVLPRAMQVMKNGLFANSPLLTRAPSLANGGLTLGPFTVRFWINPRAVWSDGTPITCGDFEFTRNAIVNTKGTYVAAGYDKVSHIDCSNPQTAMVQFSSVYADWPDVFGGASGFLLERAAFPAEADEAKVDLSAEMQDSIPFSGGPWMLQSWSKDRTVLVANPNYWVKNSLGRPTYVDRVIIYPRTDQATEIKSLESGEVWAISAFPSVTGLTASLDSNPSIKWVSGIGPGSGSSWTSLWLDISRAPFSDRAVREALFYAVDREAVMKAIVQPNDPPESQPLGCGFFAYPSSYWCDGQPFARFHYDPAMVSQILTADGWTKNVSGFWAKDGHKLAFTFYSSTREASLHTRDLVMANLRAAGFDATPSPECDLYICGFGRSRKPLYPLEIRSDSPDPSITSRISCLPPGITPGGYHDPVWCNVEATALMRQSDRELDPSKRRALLDRVYELEIQDFAPGLPLYVWPSITAWRSDLIGGPVGEWNATFYGGFFNIEQWWCRDLSECRDAGTQLVNPGTPGPPTAQPSPVSLPASPPG